MKDNEIYLIRFLKKKVMLITVMLAAAIICLVSMFCHIRSLGISGAMIYIFVSLLLVIASAIIISISIYRCYKYMVNPMNELYKSMSEIGFMADDFEKSIPEESEIKPDVTEIGESFKKLSNLISLIENINNNFSFEEMLKYIYTTFIDFVPFSYIGIALIKDDGKTIEASFGISDNIVKGLPQNIVGMKAYISETSLGEVIETGRARIINDLEEYVAGKRVKDYNRIVMEAGIKASITLPLKINNKPVGVIFFSSCSKNVYTEEHASFLETVANSIAISFEKSIFFDDMIYSSVLALAKLAEARDEDTGEHLERMKSYSRAIAQFLSEDSKYMDRITPRHINDIERFSPLHDIGKVGIKDGILLKPGRLTQEEFEQMKQHAVYGEEVLKAADEHVGRSGRSIFGTGIEIAGCHHEKWDGSGYPLGKSSENIPLSARIVAVADVFDALTSKRPYKKALSFDESFEIVVKDSGKHFDPEIIRVFEANRHGIFKIYSKFTS